MSLLVLIIATTTGGGAIVGAVIGGTRLGRRLRTARLEGEERDRKAADEAASVENLRSGHELVATIARRLWEERNRLTTHLIKDSSSKARSILVGLSSKASVQLPCMQTMSVDGERYHDFCIRTEAGQQILQGKDRRTMWLGWRQAQAAVMLVALGEEPGPMKPGGDARLEAALLRTIAENRPVANDDATLTFTPEHWTMERTWRIGETGLSLCIHRTQVWTTPKRGPAKASMVHTVNVIDKRMGMMPMSGEAIAEAIIADGRIQEEAVPDVVPVDEHERAARVLLKRLREATTDEPRLSLSDGTTIAPLVGTLSTILDSYRELHARGGIDERNAQGLDDVVRRMTTALDAATSAGLGESSDAKDRFDTLLRFVQTRHPAESDAY